MTISVCEHCDNLDHWGWEDAFCRWGFNYSLGSVQTYSVVHALVENGYEVGVQQAGKCNVVITSVKKGGIEQMQNPEGKELGFLRPRQCLPKEIIILLEATFSEKEVWELY